MQSPPQWPMPRPQDQDSATLLQEAARILRNNETQYTREIAAELIRRFG